MNFTPPPLPATPRDSKRQVGEEYALHFYGMAFLYYILKTRSDPDLTIFWKSNPNPTLLKNPDPDPIKTPGFATLLLCVQEVVTHFI